MRIFAGVALVGLMALGACSQVRTPTREELVARGEYLVVSVAGCNDCHTPMTQQGPDMTRSLQGASLTFAPKLPMPWAPEAPRLAGLPAGYSEDQFISFLQTGVRPDGSQTLPPMPHYRLNEDDARAIAAYIAQLPQTPTAPAQ
ncbi:MAG: cytochrome c [Hyphomonadaceae bacterium]